jgi:hypothetical protein
MKFFGNCDSINWQALVDSLSDVSGEARTYGVDFYNNATGKFNEIIDLWQQAGYDTAGTVEWINYYPNKHFDNKLVIQYEHYTGVTCARAWISKIRPGRYAPYHWDIDNNEDEFLKQGELVRFTTHMSTPIPGQVFIVSDQVCHMEPVGNTYQWDSYKDWHAGGNCSFESKYLFNFLGIVKK